MNPRSYFGFSYSPFATSIPFYTEEALLSISLTFRKLTILVKFSGMQYLLRILLEYGPADSSESILLSLLYDLFDTDFYSFSVSLIASTTWIFFLWGRL